MSFTFDGPNRLIICDPGVTSFSVAQVYSRWKEWLLDSDNTKYETAFAQSIGGDPLGGGLLLGSYFFLQNGWKIRPQEADHVLVIDGNIFPIPDDAGLFEQTIGSFNVQISLRTSSLTQKVQVAAVNSTASIAAEVWETDISGVIVSGSAADVIKKTKQQVTINTALSA
jgi:hypothetical protein